MTDNEANALQAQVAANAALLAALTKHAAANNVEVLKLILNDAIQIAGHNLAGAFPKDVSASATHILVETLRREVDRVTPKSALGPDGFQTKVIR